MFLDKSIFDLFPDSALEPYFSDRHSVQKKDGVFQLDRDPVAFRKMLLIIKNDHFEETGLVSTCPLMKQITNEFQFWAIDFQKMQLQKMLKDKPILKQGDSKFGDKESDLII